MQGRHDILKVHARGKKLENFDLRNIARATAGMTGADIANLMNQSAIVAVRQGRERINETDVFDVCPSAS